MATTTPNYAWVVPTSSDLVKNGATAIETLGDSVDASLWNSGYGQAGKNRFINGDFNIWQRGTSFTTDAAYTADRWQMNLSGATATFSRQSFTVGQTDVPGDPTYFARYAVTTGDNSCRIEQKIEDVTKSSSETFTVSFWAKGTNPAGGSLEVIGRQEFGSGGSTAVNVTAGTIVLTASWQRFSKTFTFASVSGKTIGTNNWYGIDIRQPSADTGVAAWTLDIANVQLEYGSYATPFQTASGGSPQAELAMCQRYYYRFVPVAGSGGNYYGPFAVGGATSTTNAYVTGHLPVALRSSPTINRSGGQIYNLVTNTAASGLGNAWTTGTSFSINVTVASGLVLNQVCHYAANNSATDYLDFSAEL